MTHHDEDEPLDPLLRAALEQLPDDIAPRTDLWAGIDRAIAPEEVPADDPVVRTTLSDLPSRGRAWPFLAVAAILLVGVGLGWLRQTQEAPAASEQITSAWEHDLQDANAQLIAQLSARDDLSPETRAAIGRNLQTIDRAIDEVHEAIARDPGSAELQQWLQSAYNQKQRVLWSALQLPEGS